MANFFTDNDDLQFYVRQALDWTQLYELSSRGLTTEDGPKDAQEATSVYMDMMEMVGKFAAEEVAPHAQAIDEAGVTLEDGEAKLAPAMEDIFRQIRELDLHWMCIPTELGGMDCPMMMYFINAEMFARAETSVMSHFGFHGGIALALLVASIREGSTEFDGQKLVRTRFAEEIKEIGRGHAWGTMDITEPDAGSDMASLRTVAEQDENGAWFVSGEKIFITSGHGKYHCVIARTEKPEGDDPFAGLGGLSLFLVPAYQDNDDGTRTRFVRIDRVEEKLGHHGSCTAALSFDRAPAQLIGERGEGFKYMLILMNSARLIVGFESIGLCESAYRMAKAYASERPSMGKTIDQHEMIADYLEQMRTETQGLRALALDAALCEELGMRGEYLPADGELDELGQARQKKALEGHRRRARRLTPLLKYLASERACEHARLAVQIHGGNGYMREYGAEKLYRDAAVLPIYEGTSQIQALMVVKDTLGDIIKQPQAFFRRLAQARWRSLSGRTPSSRRLAKLQTLAYDAQQYLMRRTATDKFRTVQSQPVARWPKAFLNDWDPKRDFSFAMLHAERLTELLAEVAICEILYKQSTQHAERQEVFDRYIRRVEPRCRHLHDLITTTGDALLTNLAGSESVSESAAE